MKHTFIDHSIRAAVIFILMMEEAVDHRRQSVKSPRYIETSEAFLGDFETFENFYNFPPKSTANVKSSVPKFPKKLLKVEHLEVPRLLSILSQHGIEAEHIVSIEVKKEPNLPIHFTSICYYITITFSEESGRANDKLELFLKKLKSNAVIKEDGDMCIFEKEAEVYTQCVPELDKFAQERMGSPKLDMLPKVYYAGELEMYMENWGKERHIVLDREKRHSFLEASLVLQSLAEFHSVSYAMIKEIGVDSFLKRYPHTKERMMLRGGVKEKINTFMINSSINIILSWLKTSNLPGSEFAYKGLSNYENKAFSTMCDIVEKEQFITVLNHGDCWNNNIMFLRDENDNLKRAKFVDLQMTRVGSPSLDISYYIYTTVDPLVRRDQLVELLQIYYKTLRKGVEGLKEKVDFSFEDFLDDYGKISKLGFLYGIFIAGANPVMGKVNMENSKNWLEDVVNAISNWLDNDPEQRGGVLTEVIGMAQDFSRFGQL